MGGALVGGSIRLLWDAPVAGRVTITNATGAPVNFTVSSSPVTFPYDMAASTTFETPYDGNYIVSVILNGFEIANTPDGVKPVTIAKGQQTIFAPSVDSVPTNGWLSLFGTPETFSHTFSWTGTVPVTAGPHRFYVEQDSTIVSVRAAVGTAPVGASLICDVNKNGTTIYTTQSSRPTILASTNTALGATPDVTTVTAGQYLTVDVDQVGSSVPGADLTLTVRLRRTV